MCRFLCVSLWVGCTRPHASLPSLVHLRDPCAGLGIPVLHAVDDMHLLVGCSDTGASGGAPMGELLHPVEGAETASVIDIHPTARGSVQVVQPTDEPTLHVDVHPGRAPRVHRVTSSKRTSSRRTAAPEANAHIRARVTVGDRVLEVGHPPKRPHDGLARWSSDAGHHWRTLPGTHPVLESVAATESTVWIAGDDFLARSTW